ncbi:hypothetical protein [Catellatospora sp. NPDC049133]|uniref:hypothetical protein n=1 Tax=Catellatospora sp. NPDC049133 TaxID=3155499 RepID=UPI0034038B38
MNFDVMSPEEVWAMLAPIITQWTPVLIGAVVLALLPMVWRRLRDSERAAKFGRAVVTPLVLAWEAQGLHELAMATGVKGPVAWVFAGLTSGLLLTLAAFADLHHGKHDNLGWPGRLVWGVAGAMGLAVAFTADNAAEAVARLILPILALIVWWIPYAPAIVKDKDSDDPAAPKRKAGSWRWTPRRIGVALGALDPTDADLIDVHAERQVRRLTTASHKLHHGWKLLRPIRASKLRRLGLLATEEMVDEVARRVALVHEIEQRTDPLRVEERRQEARLAAAEAARAAQALVALTPSPAPQSAIPQQPAAPRDEQRVDLPLLSAEADAPLIHPHQQDRLPEQADDPVSGPPINGNDPEFEGLTPRGINNLINERAEQLWIGRALQGEELNGPALLAVFMDQHPAVVRGPRWANDRIAAARIRLAPLREGDRRVPDAALVDVHA